MAVIIKPTTTYALGDYNFGQLICKVPFQDEQHQESISIGITVHRFHDRIVEVVENTEYVVIDNASESDYEIVDYFLSVRKKGDYTIVVSGVIQVKKPYKDNGNRGKDYYYKTLRLYEEYNA